MVGFQFMFPACQINHADSPGPRRLRWTKHARGGAHSGDAMEARRTPAGVREGTGNGWLQGNQATWWGGCVALPTLHSNRSTQHGKQHSSRDTHDTLAALPPPQHHYYASSSDCQQYSAPKPLTLRAPLIRGKIPINRNITSFKPYITRMMDRAAFSGSFVPCHKNNQSPS